MELRSKAKYEDVVRRLRSDIVEGVYSPGNRLPNRSDIGQQFGVGMATVQKALDMLTEDGFVRARAGTGTFVADRPPHLYNYALIVDAKGKWSRWYRSVHGAAEMVQAASDLQLNEYLTSTDVALRGGVTRLCRDVCSHRLSGLIFSSPLIIRDLAGTPALEQKDVPRVLGSFTSETNVPSVCMDVTGSFVSRAVEYLISRGRRRIAHLRLVTDFSERKMVEETLAGTGIDLRSYWQQSVYAGTMHETTPNMIAMMMQLDGDKRPDALIIYDDNLIEHATVGLMASGVKIPQELEVVAHFNFPVPMTSALPMKRLGFDCRVFLQECLDVLEMQRRGDKPPDITTIPAIFEEELGIEASAFKRIDL